MHALICVLSGFVFDQHSPLFNNKCLRLIYSHSACELPLRLMRFQRDRHRESNRVAATDKEREGRTSQKTSNCMHPNEVRQGPHTAEEVLAQMSLS